MSRRPPPSTSSADRGSRRAGGRRRGHQQRSPPPPRAMAMNARLAGTRLRAIRHLPARSVTAYLPAAPEAELTAPSSTYLRRRRSITSATRSRRHRRSRPLTQALTAAAEDLRVKARPLARRRVVPGSPAEERATRASSSATQRPSSRPPQAPRTSRIRAISR